MIIVVTWPFGREACDVGGAVLAAGGAALDAVEAGARAVELNPSVSSVGLGGLPNAEGVVELDAAIMDGRTHLSGAVAALQGIATPVSVARRVMERTPHGMLAGDAARRFAVAQGFAERDLLTPEARRRWEAWTATRSSAAVPYPGEHDTVGVVALDAAGGLAASCSTSGLAWKLPGRVGDSPVVGSGLYVDQEAGAAVATGNGDEILRVCLSVRVVTLLAAGCEPQAACAEAIRHLVAKLPGGVSRGGCACLAIDTRGRVGAAATRSGFRPPEMAWIYAVSDGFTTTLHEGAYVG